MKNAAFTLAAAAGTASAQQSLYGQCGGGEYPTECVSGAYCHGYNDFYSQCVAGSPSTSAAAPSGTAPASESACSIVTVTVDAPSGEEVAPTTALVSSDAASSSSAAVETTAEVEPSSSAAAPVSEGNIEEFTSYPEQTSEPTFFGSTPARVVSTTSSSSEAVTSSTSSAAPTTASSTTAAASPSSTSSDGKVKYAGVNISGFDFGCSTDGTCTVSGVVDPGQEGIEQMEHFVNDQGLNTFRLPVGWQYLVNDNLGGTLDSTNFDNYDALMQGCLDVADLCIIDIHNYARWNGEIVGQGGPTNEDFTSLWSQLATKYADNTKVAFGVMNEPHDVEIDTWAETVQAAVTAIRQAGATSQMILLPGNNWSHALSSVSSGSAEALAAITNLDGTVENLIYDVHQYLDSDGSGTHTECTTDNTEGFAEFGDWLRDNGRQAMLTETGGSNEDSCLTNVCAQLAKLNEYSNVYLGWWGWGAGMFDTSYEITEVPTRDASGEWTDQPIVEQCIAGQFN